ncbi:MAG: hypothetical protein GX913_07130 [Clostridiales bacterium]|nr:hypothetical protein [Clostridiales bacterium]
MHLYKRKKTLPNKGILFSLLFFILVAVYFISAFSGVSKSVNKQEQEALEQAINRAIVSCYAIEGVYPVDLAYLEEHYGIAVNYDKYIIDYNAIGSNIKPSIQVLVIGGGEE